MKKTMLITLGLVSVFSCTGPSVFAANNPRNTYGVKAGDTVWKIANRYRTSVRNLVEANGLQQPDLIHPGEKLRVPITYQVVAGDTLWKLSNTFNSTISLIKQANNLNSDMILVGQKLRIPPIRLPMKGQYVLMTRSQFKDWLFNQKLTRKITFFQEHHTYSPSYKNFDGTNYFSLMQGMKNYHVHVMGWSDISQQLTIFPDGKIVLGRPFNTPPQGSFGLLNKTVTPGIEAHALAIENVGDFDKGHDKMTSAQRQTIVTVAALLCVKFGLTPSIDSITYHHWWDINTGERVLDNSKGHAVKTCPGTDFFGGNSTADAKQNFYPLVRQKIKEIKASMK